MCVDNNGFKCQHWNTWHWRAIITLINFVHSSKGKMNEYSEDQSDAQSKDILRMTLIAS